MTITPQIEAAACLRFKIPRRARFVGVDAYVAAGGTLERDLFDEENEGYLADRALLDRLVTERSTSLVADLQAQGWAWVDVHLENDYLEALEKYNTLRPVPVDLDPALFAEADKLRAACGAVRLVSRRDNQASAMRCSCISRRCESREGVRRQRHVSRCPQFGQIASRCKQNSDTQAFHPGRRS